MNGWKKILVMAGVATLCLAASDLMAGRGGGGEAGGGGRGNFNFDPAQARQRQMDNYKERLEITDDGEWKVVEGAIGKILDAQTELRASENTGGFGRGGNRRGGGDTQDQGGGGRRGGGGQTVSPEVQALQAAIDAKAPADEIKTKLARVRDAIKAREAKVAATRADLQKLLSARQEATAVMLGLLK